MLSARSLTDASLHHLGDYCPELLYLDFSSNSNITDEGLKGLTGLKSLTKLQLNRTRIKDTGLKEMRQFTDLTALTQK